MTLVQAIAIILSQLPVPAVDRDEVGRNERLMSIAVSIDRAAARATCTGDLRLVESCKPIASNREQVAAELIELADAETNLRSNVHRGECGPHQCDASRYRVAGRIVVIHRARSLWQLHRAPTWSDEKWDGLQGATQDATDSAAWEAAKFMAGYRTMCGGTIGSFAGFATGKHCEHKQAQHRAGRAESFRRRLVALQEKEPC